MCKLCKSSYLNCGYYQPLPPFQTLDTNCSMIGLAFSLQIFSFHSFSPITSVLIKWLGVRVVAFLSSAAMAFGLFLCTLAPNATWFCVPYGLLFGIGGSFGFMVNSVIVSQYFEKVNICKTQMKHINFQLLALRKDQLQWASLNLELLLVQ